DIRVNAPGTVYHYAAWKAGSSVSVCSYTGNGADNRSISAAGFGPEYVSVKSAANEAGVHRSRVPPGDSTLAFGERLNLANAIQALETDGFQVGTDRSVNAPGGGAYYWTAFRRTPTRVLATTLVITSVNTGAQPTAGLDFSVVVESFDATGVTRPVATAT